MISRICIAVMVMVVLLAACGETSPTPTPEPEPTATITPESTDTPEPTATATLEPTVTSTPEPTSPPELKLTATSTTAPIPEIPVLEGAVIEISERYRLVYTIDHAVAEVIAAYEVEMVNAGWIQGSTRTMFENDREIFINKYHHDDAEVEVAVAEQEGEAIVSIMILSE